MMDIQELIAGAASGDDAGPSHRGGGDTRRIPSSAQPRPTPRNGGPLDDQALYRGNDLLVLHAVVPPTPRPVDPHDHRMWAVVGVDHGQEDNQLFARTDTAVLAPTEGFTVRPGDIRPLDAETIHSVRRPVAAISAPSISMAVTCSALPEAHGGTGLSSPTMRRRSPHFERLRAREDALGRAMTAEEVAGLPSSPTPGTRLRSTLAHRIAADPWCPRRARGPNSVRRGLGRPARARGA